MILCVRRLIQSGAIVLHKLFARKVVLYPNKTVVKSGKRINVGEAVALRVAEEAGIPVPHVYETWTTPDGENHIRMDYFPGQSLDKLWPDMPDEQKQDIARQLRDIVDRMRSVKPPANLIGACDGEEIRDSRPYLTYHAPACQNEEGFNEFLLSSLLNRTPSVLREALSRRFKTNHRIVLSHCDLAPRNIMVDEGKIKALIDWEYSGWYPEYWEFVEFFVTPSGHDWTSQVGNIFSEVYHDELVDFLALTQYKRP